MIDYLFVFPDKVTADAVMRNGARLTYRNSMPVAVWVEDPAAPGVVDPDTGDIVGAGERTSTDVWWAVTLPEPDDELMERPYVVLEAQRPETPVPWVDCVRRHKLTEEQVDAFLRVSPVWAGSGYIFR